MTPAEVPPGPLLVDTNVVSYIFLRKNRWQEFYELIQGHVRVVSFATVGELRSWGYKANWAAAKIASLENVISSYVVLPATDAVTDQFGAMYHRFVGHLGAGGTNDMWIASCALAQPQPLPVVTADLGHFQTISAGFPMTLIHPDL